MNIFDRLFGNNNNKDKQSLQNDPAESKFMPKRKQPIDEMFMTNFKANGGKFLYCENENDVQNLFNHILKEKSLLKRFNISDFNSKPLNADYFLTTVEYLISNTGALLVNSDQIGEKKLNELPYNFIVIATTSQLLETIGEGLQLIKRKKNTLPSNITTMKTFEGKEESDFMSYGSPSKNLYLLLLEDL